MGKKKKKDSNRLAKMSDEERARYLQHRADIEEEARRRKEELISSYLKTKLKHEDAFMRINIAKINQEWRQILRRTKCKELKSELQALQSGTDELLERKENIVQQLLTEIDEGDNQYERNFQAHLTSIDSLINIYMDRLKDLNTWYEQRKDEMTYLSIQEKMTTEKNYEESCNHLKTIIFQNQQDFEKYSKEMKSLRIDWQQEYVSEMEFQYELLVNKKESEAQALMTEIIGVLKKYLAGTEKKRRDYNHIKKLDNEENRCIEEQGKLIGKLTKLYSKIVQHYDNLRQTNDDHLAALRQKQNILSKNAMMFKKALTEAIAKDENQLKKMSVTSNKALEYLKKIYEKGEQILILVSLCRQLETEKEKIDPWDGYEENPETDYKDDVNKLEKFWWRYNLVLLEDNQLKNEKQQLLQENKRMKAEIREVFSEVVLEGPTRTSETSLALIPQITISKLKGKELNVPLKTITS